MVIQKKCTNCAELINNTASFCKYCGTDFRVIQSINLDKIKISEVVEKKAIKKEEPSLVKVTKPTNLDNLKINEIILEKKLIKNKESSFGKLPLGYKILVVLSIITIPILLLHFYKKQKSTL